MDFVQGKSAVGRKQIVLCTLIGFFGYLLRSQFEGRSLGRIISIKNGKLQGTTAVSRDGREFDAFLGIPYAKPPLGELRFESPQPAEKWEGILDATKFGSVCTQIDMISGSFLGEESCLFVNVFVPKGAKGPLPTMVFIHGGLFMFGSSNRHGPEYFMDEDIALVTFNYRLNSLGFLNTNDGVVRGNMGLKDQVLALKWVQENVADFGGDPGKVTIFGESAGAVSVHLHLLSPLSKGLFHKAISQSGTALNPWALRQDPVAQAIRLGRRLRCPTDSSHAMISCMKNLTVTDIVHAHYESLDPNRKPITLFVPTVERGPVDHSTFLAEEPQNIVESGRAHRVPWLTGVVSNEGLIYSAVIIRNKTMLELVKSKFEDLAAELLFFKQAENGASEMIKNYYFPPEDEKSNNDSSIPKEGNSSVQEFKNYTQLFTDRGFNVGIHRTVMSQAQYSPVYLYYNTYGGEFSLTHYLLAFKMQFPIVVELLIHVVGSWINKIVFQQDPPFYGVCHADDVALLFKIPWISNIVKSDRDYTMSKSLVKIWTGFANDEKSLKFNGIKWEPNNNSTLHSQEKLQYMHIDSRQGGMIPEPFTDTVKFWLKLQLDNYL